MTLLNVAMLSGHVLFIVMLIVIMLSVVALCSEYPASLLGCKIIMNPNCLFVPLKKTRFQLNKINSSFTKRVKLKNPK